MQKADKLKKFFICTAVLCGFIAACARAQTPEDISECFKEGQKCYRSGNLTAAALEFENILTIDKHNFEAKVWLAQVYIALRAYDKAEAVLFEASLQAGQHPRVVKLQALLNSVKKPKGKTMSEALPELSEAKPARKYGIVIPENKVVKPVSESDMLSFIEQNRQQRFKGDKKTADGPFAAVLETEAKEGIEKALSQYFAMIFEKPSLAGISDEGLLERGRSLFAKRFADDDKNAENRFYYGAITFIEGSVDEAEHILSPLRDKDTPYKEQLKPFFAGIDEWLRQKDIEKEQKRQAELAMLAKEEEERIRKENEEKQRKLAEEYRVRQNNAAASQTQNVSENIENAPTYKEGYDLYKRGKLDDAIAKFKQGLKEYGDKPLLHYRLGLAYTDKAMGGDMAYFESAITAFQQVIAIDPRSKLADESRIMIKDIESVYTGAPQ